MIAAAFVFEPIRLGMTEESQIRSASMPRTRNYGSTTERSSDPILQVPTG